MSTTTVEEMLTAIIDGETIDPRTPRSRLEEILMTINAGEDYTDLPRSRLEELLLELGEKINSTPDVDEEGNVITQYTGTYDVTPSTELQELQTADKKMTKNVTVQAIPYHSVSNNYGGETITIGGNT